MSVYTTNAEAPPHQPQGNTGEAASLPYGQQHTGEKKKKKRRRVSPIRAMRNLWERSLQFRSLSSAGILMIMAFILVGSSLSNQIATSLFENKKTQALEESNKGFVNVQSVLDSSEARSDSEINRDVRRYLPLMDAGGDDKRQWILLPLNGTPLTRMRARPSHVCWGSTAPPMTVTALLLPSLRKYAKTLAPAPWRHKLCAGRLKKSTV